MFYKALQNCPWAKVSPKVAELHTFPGTFPPSLSARPSPVSLWTGHIPDLVVQLSPAEPQLMGDCFLSLRWSCCFTGTLPWARGSVICPKAQPRR